MTLPAINTEAAAPSPTYGQRRPLVDSPQHRLRSGSGQPPDRSRSNPVTVGEWELPAAVTLAAGHPNPIGPAATSFQQKAYNHAA